MHINFNIVTPLCEIMTRNRSDKGNTDLNYAWHHYTMFYYELLKNIKNKKLRLFELGMGTTDISIDSNMGPNGRPGASLFGWAEFFPNAEIFGADIDKKILFVTDRIKTYYCDQTDSECVKNMWLHPDLKEKFDVIIDDGLHRYFSNKCFFENSIHKLKDDGYYIIEDINNSRDLPQLMEIVNEWKNIYTDFTFELIKFPSHWNNYDNNIMLIKRKEEKDTISATIQLNNINDTIVENSTFISYSTTNYENITNKFLDSLHKIGIKNENIKYKLDTYDDLIFENEGFQSDLWYYANLNKLMHLITILENYKKINTKYFIFTDCDIIFIEKNKEEWNNLQKFIDENENDIFFMRENTYDIVNAGFFIIKKNKNIKYIISFFKFLLNNLLNREKQTIPCSIQTVINELLNNINYDYIPNEFVVYGDIIFNSSKSLFHHAVKCNSLNEKNQQINYIKSFF
jgi:hypothetical protein